MTSVVGRNTVNRIIKDIREVKNDDSLAGIGIFYEHDLENFMNAHAMIIGPSDTPYEDGMFFFHFLFPDDYPFSPPKVKFLSKSNKNRVRINPNLYTDGKVCLSVLNTWDGEPWSACQTIRSVLLTLVTVLNEKPLMNEPGIQPTSVEHPLYNRIVKFTSLYDCCLHMQTRLNKLMDHETIFEEKIRAHLKEKAEKAEKELRVFSRGGKIDTETGKEILQSRCYGMRVEIDWPTVIASLDQMNSK